jgi:hypothetical protein
VPPFCVVPTFRSGGRDAENGTPARRAAERRRSVKHAVHCDKRRNRIKTICAFAENVKDLGRRCGRTLPRKRAELGAAREDARSERTRTSGDRNGADQHRDGEGGFHNQKFTVVRTVSL